MITVGSFIKVQDYFLLLPDVGKVLEIISFISSTGPIVKYKTYLYGSNKEVWALEVRDFERVHRNNHHSYIFRIMGKADATDVALAIIEEASHARN
jgi:hypothetical protein